MTGRPQAIARKDLCALGKVPAESRGAFSKFFHPETSSYALHNSRGCLHRVNSTSGTSGVAYLVSLYEPYEIYTILISSYTYHDKI